MLTGLGMPNVDHPRPDEITGMSFERLQQMPVEKRDEIAQ